MDNFEIEYKRESLEEMNENLDGFNDIVRELENGNDIDDLFNELFRLVHNIKGNAKSAGFDSFSSIVHELESRLILYRDNKMSFSDKDTQILGACHSAFQDSIDKLSENLSAELEFSDLEKEISLFGGKEEKEYSFLVVDDEVEITDIFEGYLMMEFDCEVTKVYDGEEALLLCEKNQYDAIVTDYSMPKVNGQELIRTIRNGNSPNMNTPILFVSGFRPNLVPETKMWENVFILEKPFRPERLSFMIKCSNRLRKTA